MKRFFYCLSMFVLISCQGEVRDDSKTNESEEPVESNGLPNEPEIVEEYIPMDMDLTSLQSDDLPDCDYDGYIDDCWGWDDKNGRNFLVRTREEVKFEEVSEFGDEVHSQTLHVYHYLQTEGGSYTLFRDLTDFEKQCDFDLNVSHIDAVELSDLNQDNIGEVIFGYRLACRSDVSPSVQKVVMFEAGDKYILRGSSVTIGFGGEYEVGSEFETAPEGYLAAVEAYWEANKVEFE